MFNYFLNIFKTFSAIILLMIWIILTIFNLIKLVILLPLLTLYLITAIIGKKNNILSKIIDSFKKQITLQQ
jgi:hypothetical protein